jgi:uncharacterized membrane protein
MYVFLKWLYLLALIVWVGEVIFFSFVVAPAMFRTFSVVEAGRAVGAIFPMYYRIGYGCGVLLLITTLIFLATAEVRTWLGVTALLVAGMLAATVYAGVVIQPRATELRPQIHDPAAPASAKEEFDRLHHQAVVLNGMVLLAGVVVSAITATTLRL